MEQSVFTRDEIKPVLPAFIWLCTSAIASASQDSTAQVHRCIWLCISGWADSPDSGNRAAQFSSPRHAERSEIRVQHAHIILRTNLLEEIAWRSPVAFHPVYPAYGNTIRECEVRAWFSCPLEYDWHPVGSLQRAIRPYRIRVRNGDIEMYTAASTSHADHDLTHPRAGFSGRSLMEASALLQDHRCYELHRSSRREPSQKFPVAEPVRMYVYVPLQERSVIHEHVEELIWKPVHDPGQEK